MSFIAIIKPEQKRSSRVQIVRPIRRPIEGERMVEERERKVVGEFEREGVRDLDWRRR